MPVKYDVLVVGFLSVCLFETLKCFNEVCESRQDIRLRLSYFTVLK